MKILTTLCACLALLFSTVGSASADDLYGNAVYFARGPNKAEFCFIKNNTCYTFGVSRGACAEINSQGIQSAVTLLRHHAEENVDVYLRDCGAPLNGAYAGSLCVSVVTNSGDRSLGCFDAEEIKSLRQHNVPLD